MPSEQTRDEIDLTLFVPCLNEEPRIAGTLNEIREAMRRLGYSYEVLVVDDGSTDGTYAAVERFQRENPDMPVDLHKNPVNLGVAHSFIDTAFRGRGRYYRLVWGDDVEPADSMVEIFKHLGKYDLVIPYYVKVEGKTLARDIISRTYTLLVNTLGGHRIHYYNGSCLIRRYEVMRWAPRNAAFTGFFAGLITDMLNRGASHIEVALTGRHAKKEKELSPLKFKTFVLIGFTLLDIFIRRIERGVTGHGSRPVKKAGVR